MPPVYRQHAFSCHRDLGLHVQIHSGMSLTRCFQDSAAHVIWAWTVLNAVPSGLCGQEDGFFEGPKVATGPGRIVASITFQERR